MGTKANPSPHDCYARALPDEPIFTLIARDRGAAECVRQWARERLADIAIGARPESDRDQVAEAYECARAMEAWRAANVRRGPHAGGSPADAAEVEAPIVAPTVAPGGAS
jgi:hypothetical protein